MARLAGLVVLFLGTVLASVALAQEPPDRSDILLKMTRPAPATPPQSVTRDDLRPVPPSPDKLSDAVRFDVRVGDPRCRPGEEMWGLDPVPPRRRARSQH